MLGLKDRRKVTGIIVNPAALFRFSIPFFVLLIANFIIIECIHWQIYKEIAKASDAGIEGIGTVSVLERVINDATHAGLWGVVIMSVMTFALWTYFSHRIFGPTVPIRRQIENLCAGKYSERIQLRKYDELKDVAGALNRLAEVLENKENADLQKPIARR
jgi:HAMP domain-containing protein